MSNSELIRSTVSEISNSTKIIVLAATSPVFKRENGDRGILICFRNKSSLNFDIVSYESCHAADYICEELGITGQSFSENNEHYTYLVGWIAKCCEETKNYHNKH